MNLKKLDWLCVSFMIIVIMAAAGFWALTASILSTGSESIWVGWVWGGMFAICIIVIIIFVISMEPIWSRIRRR